MRSHANFPSSHRHNLPDGWDVPRPSLRFCQITFDAVVSGYGLESVWQDMTAGISCIGLLKLASQDVAPRTPLSLTQNQPAAQDRDLAREFDIHSLPRLQVPERIGQRPQIGCLDAGENQKPVARFEPGLLGA